MMQRVKSHECDRCPSTENLQVVALLKPNGALVGPGRNADVKLGHVTLCPVCIDELEDRGYHVTVLPAVVAR